MSTIKTLTLSAAVAAGLAMTLPTTAAVIDISPGASINAGTFCAAGGGGEPNTYRTGRYSYTCYIGSAGQTLDPAAAHMAVKNLANTSTVVINEFTFGGLVTGTLQVTGYPGGVLTGSLSYFIELTPPPGFTDTDQPGIRFSTIRLTQETLQQNAANTATRKQITGQNNAVVTNATFTADLNAVGQGGTDSEICGVCRKFAVTDSFNNDVNGGGDSDAGRIQSFTNTYETTLVPVPAPLALMALGLVGVGMARRRRAA